MLKRQHQVRRGDGSPLGSKVRALSALAVGSVVAACAASPEGIAAMPASGAQYRGLQCAELAREMAALDETIAVLSTQQRTKRVNDVVGWIYVLLPVASLTTKDDRPEIALRKGEREAIGQAMASRCTYHF